MQGLILLLFCLHLNMPAPETVNVTDALGSVIPRPMNLQTWVGNLGNHPQLDLLHNCRYPECQEIQDQYRPIFEPPVGLTDRSTVP
jgi:hypothetical protein